MKFIDQTEIKVRAGHGGPGRVSFRSAKYRPKAGCDGGDGGFGGDVIILGDQRLNTLSTLYYRKEYIAEHGQIGGTNNCNGADGQCLVIPLPLGTEIWDQDTGQKLLEVLQDGERTVLAQGGKRGLGNARFLSSRHQAPEECTPGGEGKAYNIRLCLKLMADVGLAGFPNAGKSTLLSRVSAARPKIADYPFTTLSPQLGVVSYGDLSDDYGESFVMADIPGLVEGAHEGKGLGLQFLQHLERTRLILYLVDPFDPARDPAQALEILNRELHLYSAELHAKPHLIVFTKTELSQGAGELGLFEELKQSLKQRACPYLEISSHTGEGLRELKIAIKERLRGPQE